MKEYTFVQNIGDIPDRHCVTALEQAVYDSTYCIPIYIVLTDTRSFVSKGVRLFKGDRFTHAAIAFNSKLEPMYSFGFKNMKNEEIRKLNAPKKGWNKGIDPYSKLKAASGFTMDTVDICKYGRPEETCYYEVFVMFISKKEMEAMQERLEHFKNNSQVQSFHLAGLFFNLFNIPFEYENDYFCSRFVATVIAATRNLDMAPSLYCPQDLAYLPYTTMVNSGQDIRKYDYKVTDKAVQEIIETKAAQNCTEYVKSFLK